MMSIRFDEFSRAVGECEKLAGWSAARFSFGNWGVERGNDAVSDPLENHSSLGSLVDVLAELVEEHHGLPLAGGLG